MPVLQEDAGEALPVAEDQREAAQHSVATTNYSIPSDCYRYERG